MFELQGLSCLVTQLMGACSRIRGGVRHRGICDDQGMHRTVRMHRARSGRPWSSHAFSKPRSKQPAGPRENRLSQRREQARRSRLGFVHRHSGGRPCAAIRFSPSAQAGSCQNPVPCRVRDPWAKIAPRARPLTLVRVQLLRRTARFGARKTRAPGSGPFGMQCRRSSAGASVHVSPRQAQSVARSVRCAWEMASRARPQVGEPSMSRRCLATALRGRQRAPTHKGTQVHGWWTLARNT